MLYTLSYSDTNINSVVKTLENESINLIDWFSKNLMKANPDKFQAIAIDPNRTGPRIDPCGTPLINVSHSL
jgi:hypothetical protein